MLLDLGDVGKDVVPRWEIIAEGLPIPEIDTVNVGHYVGYTGFGSRLDKLGVGAWGSIEGQGDDEQDLALEGGNQRFLVIIVNRGDFYFFGEGAYCYQP